MTLTQLDLNLFDAWTRVGARLKDDPGECLRRWRRVRQVTARRPLRVNCLVIRAADTRLNDFWCVTDPRDACEQKQPHTLRIAGEDVRRVCAPVKLPWPGMDWQDAAACLGRPADTLGGWIRRGWLEVSYTPARTRSKRGKPVPMVWSPTSLDPNARRGAAPDEFWGTLWQWNWELMPEQFEQDLQREPVWKPRLGRRVFRGWYWRCPGRSDAGAPCGRRCRYLFAPLPVWTLAKATSVEHSLPMPDDQTPAGTWHPGLDQVQPGFGDRRFACTRCWQVQHASMTRASGWNDFVTCASGGMLYGHEVERPLEEVPMARKRAPNLRPRTDKGRKRGAAVREEVLPAVRRVG